MMHSVSKKMLVLLLGISLAHAMQGYMQGDSDKEVVGWKLVYKHKWTNSWNPQTFKISRARNEFTYTDSSGDPVTIRYGSWKALKKALRKPSEADEEKVNEKQKKIERKVFTRDHGLVVHNFEKGKLKEGGRAIITNMGQLSEHGDHVDKYGTVKARNADGTWNVAADNESGFMWFSEEALRPVKTIYFTYHASDDPWGYIHGGGSGNDTGIKKAMGDPSAAAKLARLLQQQRRQREE